MDVFCSIKYKFGELREGVLYLSGKRCLSEKNSVVAHSWIVLVLLWHHNETFIVWELTSRASMDCVCVCGVSNTSSLTIGMFFALECHVMLYIFHTRLVSDIISHGSSCF